MMDQLDVIHKQYQEVSGEKESRKRRLDATPIERGKVASGLICHKTLPLPSCPQTASDGGNLSLSETKTTRSSPSLTGAFDEMGSSAPRCLPFPGAETADRSNQSTMDDFGRTNGALDFSTMPLCDDQPDRHNDNAMLNFHETDEKTSNLESGIPKEPFSLLNDTSASTTTGSVVPVLPGLLGNHQHQIIHHDHSKNTPAQEAGQYHVLHPTSQSLHDDGHTSATRSSLPLQVQRQVAAGSQQLSQSTEASHHGITSLFGTAHSVMTLVPQSSSYCIPGFLVPALPPPNNARHTPPILAPQFISNPQEHFLLIPHPATDQPLQQMNPLSGRTLQAGQRPSGRSGLVLGPPPHIGANPGIQTVAASQLMPRIGGALFHMQQALNCGVAGATSPSQQSTPSPHMAVAPFSDNQSAMTLYMACDDDSLSEFQCLVRQQIELFAARAEEMESNAKGRNKPIMLGQVGIRCRHCSMLSPKDRTRGATYYPAKLNGLYQAAQSMASGHLCHHCQHIPQQIRQELLILKERKSSAGGGKKYWGDGVVVLGVYEDTDGLRLRSSS